MKLSIRDLPFAILSLLLLACEPQISKETTNQENSVQAFRTGAEVWMEGDFGDLKGKSVGLLVNHTARVDSMHLSDVVWESPAIELGAMFGPEHGIRGEADAGEEISDGIDRRTGVPVYSLYGDTRKPSVESLENLDALVFDIQDIGARFYTYISTMGMAMQAAAEAGISFVVLDRPNPLGGEYVSGFVLEPGYESFVGAYPIPIAHGLTVGELATMIQGEGWLEGLDSLDLQIIQMEGWNRSERWTDLGLEWHPTSPNIPDFETALAYPGMCFFEAVNASEGRGTRAPFLQAGAQWANEAALAARLTAFDLPGVRFDAHSFTPESIEGMSSNPRFKDQMVQGIRLAITDANVFDPVAAGIYAIWAFYDQAPESEKSDFLNERWMNRLAGTDRLFDQLKAGVVPEEIVESWAEEVSAFKQLRRGYLIY